MTANSSKDPVVEPNTAGDVPETGLRALQLRIRQQELLANLGVVALQGASLDELLSETVQLTAKGLDAEFCKILEYIPSTNRLLVRAGFGWDAGVVGTATVGADLDSPAGYALHTGKPVISNHLENEERFRTSDLLKQHGIRRAMNVILQGDGKPFGVLEVDSRSEDEFLEHDLAFLQGAANVLGMAIERERNDRSLTAALERHQVLLKEMNHRVKNSLSIVASMLSLQARGNASPEVTEQLTHAANRVAAVGRLHDHLSVGFDVERLDIGRYVGAVCKDLNGNLGRCDVVTDFAEGMFVATDRAISIALIVNELITNAAKYAYDSEVGGKINVAIGMSTPETMTISVRDEGDGLPPEFDLLQAKGLGTRIIAALVHQLSAIVAVKANKPGTEFVVSIPLAVLTN